MSAEAELRLSVYQEGQRAYLSGSPCPYEVWDWKSKTWDKGYAAGKAYYNETDNEPENEVEPTLQTLKEEIADLRGEVEWLSSVIADLRFDVYRLRDGRGEE
jgi:hypothetical protein